MSPTRRTRSDDNTKLERRPATRRRDPVHIGLAAALDHASHDLAEETNNSRGSGDSPEIASAGDNEDNGVATALLVKEEGPRHAHFDCFSGAAGDMMLAACLDAHPHPEMLLERIAECLRRGLPALANEFSVTQTRVWRGQGSIAARYVSVSSLYHHAPAPVPSHHDPNHHTHNHHHDQDEQHDHHSHEHQHSQHENNHQEDVQHHSHEHSHGHDHSHQSNNNNSDSHDHEHSHGHADQNGHGEGSGGPPLRNLPEIKAMLEEASVEWIPKKVKDWAVETFTALAEAEAMTHGATSINAVHFHEVGAVDSIVDTVGTLLGLNELGVSTVSCSRLPMGEGTVWTDHGLLPVPAPATLRLLIGMPTCPGPPGLTGELVTPTAAALLRTLTKPNDTHKNMAGRAPAFTPRAIGMGAGTKDFVKHPNIIRLIIGDNIATNDQVDISKTNKTNSDQVAPALLETNIPAIKSPQKQATHPLACKRTASSEEKEGVSPKKKLKTRWKTDYLTHLEANLDDTTAEILAYTVELLLQKGAVDAWVVPIVMKKGRAAHTLHCLCRSMENQKDLVDELLLIIFRQTTTLGIRIHRGLERAALYRSIVPIQTPWMQEDSKTNGLVDVKVSYLGDNSDNEEDAPEVVSIKAEFDHCRRVSQASGVPLKRVAEYATREVCDQIESKSRLLDKL
eukprot:scaffold32954_cov51-Attheya_sp.AAC.3